MAEIDRELATLPEGELAKRKLLELKKKTILVKINGLNNIKTELDKVETEYDKYINNKGFSILLDNTIDISKNDEMLKWQKAPFNTNPNYLEQLSYNCPSGNMVRSKSEVFIDMILSQNGLPYRYEAELILGQDTFYPDFTIRHPLNNKIIYWEHLGMMDNPEYTRKVFQKLQKYCYHGIIPGDNLILTYESKGNPFSFSDAEKALATLKA